MGEVEEDIEAVEHAVRENDFRLLANGPSRSPGRGYGKRRRTLEIVRHDGLLYRRLGRCCRLRLKWNHPVFGIWILCGVGHESNAANAIAVEHARVTFESEDAESIYLDDGLLLENADGFASACSASLRNVHRLVIVPFETKCLILDFEDCVLEEEVVDLAADLQGEAGEE